MRSRIHSRRVPFSNGAKALSSPIRDDCPPAKAPGICPNGKGARAMNPMAKVSTTAPAIVLPPRVLPRKQAPMTVMPKPRAESGLQPACRFPRSWSPFDPSGSAAQNVKRRGLRTSNDGHTGREGKLLGRRPGDKRDYLTFASVERLDAFVPVESHHDSGQGSGRDDENPRPRATGSGRSTPAAIEATTEPARSNRARKS